MRCGVWPSALMVPPATAAPARRVLVVGDSAGGGLALSLMHALHVGECSAGGVSSAGVRPPSAVVALSPWTDLTSSLPSYSSRAFDKTRRRASVRAVNVRWCE